MGREMFVWRGLGLGNCLRLFRQRPAIDASGYAAALSMLLTAPLNSLLGTAESLLWSRQIKRVQLNPSPIFILGHWRSGTSLLHRLLTLDSRFAYVDLYQSLFPGHFLLSQRLLSRLTASWLPPTRPMDNMPCGWELPEEDETAMMLMTLKSPYLSVAFPDDCSKYSRFEDLKQGLSSRELDRWRNAFRHFLRKVALYRKQTRFVLKSPPHTVRIPLLKQWFPDAHFIYLVRNPYDVYGSTLRLRRVMARINGFSRQEPADLEEQVLDGYMRMYHAYHLHRALVAKSHLHEMCYEDLVAHPIAAVAGIYRQFGIPGFEEVRPRIEARLQEHRTYHTTTEPLSRIERQRVYEHWEPAFRRYGYPSGLDDVTSCR